MLCRRLITTYLRQALAHNGGQRLLVYGCIYGTAFSRKAATTCGSHIIRKGVVDMHMHWGEESRSTATPTDPISGGRNFHGVNTAYTSWTFTIGWTQQHGTRCGLGRSTGPSIRCTLMYHPLHLPVLSGYGQSLTFGGKFHAPRYVCIFSPVDSSSLQVGSILKKTHTLQTIPPRSTIKTYSLYRETKSFIHSTPFRKS